MRRAIGVTVLLLAGAALLAVGVFAQGKPATRVNAIGFIDYTTKPAFKVGDWVRYHIVGESELGMRDDYELTILIAGEELFWGDSCFWLETWMDPKSGPSMTLATLMSYSIFRDSLPIQRMQLYQRKQVEGTDEQGNLHEILLQPVNSVLKIRTLFNMPLMWDVDTLGSDTVSTPVGEFQCRKVSIRQGSGVTRTTGDSSRYDEERENRMMWMDPRVPITHVARESVENLISRRTWMIGRSSEGSALLRRERGLGLARLVGMGSGLEPRLVPAGRRMDASMTARDPKPAKPPGGSKRR